ncbi:MAG: MBL fold metallo-hydrolase [Paraprevotella sp.]|nr:MBL fold metallo-hydrolase [Paraprevotella sp.]
MKCRGTKGWMIGAMVVAMSAVGVGAAGFALDGGGSASANPADSGLKTVELGDVKVTWIEDNATEMRMAGSLFKGVPEDLAVKLSLDNGLPASCSAFLVETRGIKILFDTGFGRAGSRLVPRLHELGVEPEEIRYLYLTHFHGDHIGGMMKDDTPVFPRPEVYVSKVEYDAWMKMPSDRNALQVKTMKAYEDSLHFFKAGDVLPGEVQTIDARGHTPGHTVYRVGRLLIIGDLIHGAALQMAHPEFCASYDMDPEKAVRSRRRILEYARENHLTLAGMHLPAPAFVSE